jgi:ankyrin repeat protein
MPSIYNTTPWRRAVISSKSAETIGILIEAGANVEENISGETPLMIAAGNNANAEKLKVFIAAGADLETRNARMRTPLMIAAERNENPETIKILVNAGSDINAEDYFGWTPLMIAAKYNANPEISLALIRSGADVNAEDPDGWTPLMLAAGDNRNPEVLKALMKEGADIGAKDRNGRTPLMFAAPRAVNPEIISCLLDAGANVSDGILEAARSNEKIIGADVMKALEKRWSENSPSERAAASPLFTRDVENATRALLSNAAVITPEEASRLIAMGADADVKDHENYLTPLLIAVKSNPHPEVIKILAKAGADIGEDFRYPYNNPIYPIYPRTVTALTLAIECERDPEIIDALIKCGADIRASGQSDMGTALMAAVEKGNFELASLLLRYGADANTTISMWDIPYCRPPSCMPMPKQCPCCWNTELR